MKLISFLALVFFLWSCQGNDQKTDQTTPAQTSIPEPQNIGYTILNTYPHDTSAFTQGLEIYKGGLYESTGLNDHSSLRQVDLKTGKPLEKKVLEKEFFAEGITILNDTLYQLTYQNHVVLVYQLKDFKLIRKLNWSSEGWGITNDGTNLIVSDGSDKLYYVHPVDFKLLKVLSVSDNLGPVNNLNELEFIDGYIYANRWQYNYILKIDPASGLVVGKMDFTNLLQNYSKADLSYLTREGSLAAEHGAVLNGIAWDSTQQKMFITGKLWPSLFEVKLNN